VLYLTWLLLSTATLTLFTVALYRLTRRGSAPLVTNPGAEGPSAPPLTVLKPLCGADDDLAENLRSFFALDYPAFELLFGVEDAADPAVAIVTALQARYPEVKSRLVVDASVRALNPKISNLRGMLASGSEAIVVISDSNVRVAPDYLWQLVAAFDEPRVGLVTSLVVGDGEETLGALLNNVQVNGVIAGSIAASAVLRGDAVVIGKSLLFRRATLDSLGGWESLSTVLAEDYVIERMFLAAGFRIAVTTSPVVAICRRLNLGGYLGRHIRWAMLRWRLFPLRYPLELCANPLALALVAPLVGGGAFWPLSWALVVTLARDGLAWHRLRGREQLLGALAAGLFKDVLMIGVWLAAPFRRHVRWRGTRLYLSAGTRLYAEQRAVMRGGRPDR
ncbi:MAG: glycosyltransferase, partial [Myxococcales bacterium]|nr:glycosyltransferase [Myxococcales bacterium]